jgi:putative membrane protein
MRIEARRVGLGLLAVVAACTGGTNGARQNQAAAGGSTSTDTAAATGKSGTTTPRAGLSDSNIVALLDEANQSDSTAGAIALKKATNADVKAFARLMMSEHHALRAAGQDLAKQLNVAPKPPEHDPIAGYAKTEIADLQKTAKGAEFDRLYIDHEVSVHQAVLDFANMARVTTQTPELRDLIQKAIPVLQKHLEQAQALQKKLNPST